ncbi:MAG: hypothetical protein CVV02_09240 [Firmicutes bacterium HGW-Firmicutes-7]|nr:MAG: hypothetical protein CVV02_09240 [Firmicutes bacterium HGW-Firmicutes-7]
MLKKNLVYLFMVLLVVRPVFSILDGIYDVIGLISVLLILTVLMIVNHILSRLSVVDYIFLLMYLLTWIVELCIYRNYFESLDHGLKVLLVIEMIIFLAHDENIYILMSLMQTIWVRILLTIQLLIISAVFFVQLLNGYGYKKIWGDQYFVSFLSSAHVLSYLLILLMAICLYLYTMNPKPHYIAFICYLVVIQQFTGVRAIFIAILFLVGLTVYCVFKRRKKQYFILFISALCSIIFCIIITGIWVQIPMAKKMIYRVDTETVDGGRTTFWVQNLVSYTQFDFSEKLTGKSFLYPYQNNFQISGMYIWSHNDFINILLSLGAFGLIAYLFFYIKFLVYLHKKITSLPWTLTVLFLLCIPLLNGFYNYPDMAFSLAFLTLVFLKDKQEAAEIAPEEREIDIQEKRVYLLHKQECYKIKKVR